MKAEIEHRVSNLRLWIHDWSKYGDPYQLFLELIWRDSETVEMVGLTEKIQREHWQAIIECCERNGIRRIVAKRFRKGVEQSHVIEVR